MRQKAISRGGAGTLSHMASGQTKSEGVEVLDQLFRRNANRWAVNGA